MDYKPQFVAIELTNQCLNNCFHCGAKGVSFEDNSVFSKEKLIELVRHISDSEIDGIRITGGDPFLSEHIFNLVSYASSRNIEIVKINTTTRIKKDKSQKQFLNSLLLNGFALNNSKYTSIISIGIGPQQINPNNNPLFSNTDLTSVLNTIKDYSDLIETKKITSKLNIEINNYTHEKLDILKYINKRDLSLVEYFKKKPYITFNKRQILKTTTNNIKIKTNSEFNPINWDKWGNCLLKNNRYWQSPIIFIRANGNIYSCMGWDNFKTNSKYYLGNIMDISLNNAIENANKRKNIIDIKSGKFMKLVNQKYLELYKNGDIQQIDDINDLICTICQKIY